MRRPSLFVGVVALVALAGCSPQLETKMSAAQAKESAPRDSTYPLDARDRAAPPGAPVKCEPADMVMYRGAEIRYATAAAVHPSFTQRLERFERIAREVGMEVYGRAPATLHHAGAYSCRTMPSGRYSEHAFGNALDLEGFSFPAADGKPAIRIHVREAWRADGSPDAKRFFARLLERLEERDDVFRAIVGPPAETHEDHLHLDMGPWAYSRYEPPQRS